MKSIAFAAPALPDGVKALKETADEILGPRRVAFDAFHRRMGITKEHWFVQQTPQGPIILAVLEGNDLAEMFGKLATATEPFDVWFRERARMVHGIDFTQPMPGPMPEQILGVNRN